MTYLQEKTLDTPGLHTHIVKTEKFKTVTILLKCLHRYPKMTSPCVLFSRMCC